MQVWVGILEHAIQIFQPLAKFASPVSVEDIIQYGLVVLINQHHDALPMDMLGVLDQVGEIVGNSLRRRCLNFQVCSLLLQLITNVGVQVLAAVNHSAGETEA